MPGNWDFSEGYFNGGTYEEGNREKTYGGFYVSFYGRDYIADCL